MNKKVNSAWLPVAVIATVLLCIFVVHDMLEKPNTVVPNDYKTSAQIQSLVDNATAPLQEQINSLTKQLAEKAVEVAEEVKESLGYLIDKIFLDDFSEMDLNLSDREVKTLLDSEVSFDGEDYDFEEVVTLDNMNVSANEEDFEGTPYLVIPSDSIRYEIRFDSNMSNLNISDEETLEFTFLGEEVEVSEWKSNEITFSQGTETLLDSGETLDVNGKTLTLTHVMDDSVYVTVDGESKKIVEGETKTINGVEVEVKNVIYSEVGPVTKAVLVTGKEVKVEIEDGDEFEEDSIWEYVVTSDSIGLVLKEEFNELDDELKPLASGESICLPNGYVCVRYNGFVDEDFEEINFELEDRFVQIDGNFQVGLKDFDRLLVNATGVYDEDEEVVNGTILIGNSDVELEVNTTTEIITIEGFTLNFDLNDSSVDDSADYSVRTNFGILVENPEDSVDDSEWTISVPEEKLESTITVY